MASEKQDKPKTIGQFIAEQKKNAKAATGMANIPLATSNLGNFMSAITGISPAMKKAQEQAMQLLNPEPSPEDKKMLDELKSRRTVDLLDALYSMPDISSLSTELPEIENPLPLLLEEIRGEQRKTSIREEQQEKERKKLERDRQTERRIFSLMGGFGASIWIGYVLFRAFTDSPSEALAVFFSGLIPAFSYIGLMIYWLFRKP